MKNIYKINFWVLLMLLSVSLSAQDYKPTTATQSATQDANITLNTPGAYQTNGYINIVRSYDVYKWNMSDTDIQAANADRQRVALTTQYLDGLGRPIQSVSRQATPDGKDMVQMMFYDKFGREAQSFLPYPSQTATNGAFVKSPFTAQKAVFDTHFNDKEDIFYGITEFDHAPSGVVRKTMAPGNSWAGAGKGTTSEFFNNTTDHKIRYWTIGDDATDEPQSSSDYGVNQLTFTIVTDEDGRQMREFKDKEGRVILRQIKDNATPSDSYDGWMSTQYIYDSRGNLRFVFPPMAIEALRGTSSWNTYDNAGIDDLIFKYVYDLRNRMIISQTPGAGEVHTVYDFLDRPVLTQDANQRETTAQNPYPRWTFIKYDERNRPALSGFITASDANYDTREELQTQADNWGNKDYFVKVQQPCGIAGEVEGHSITVSEHVSGTSKYKAADYVDFLPGFETTEEFETEVGASVCEDYTYYQGYYDATFPSLKDYGDTGDFEMISVNYYDNYDFTSKEFYSQYNTYGDFYTSQQDALDHLAVVPVEYKITHGLPTSSKVRVLGTDDWLTSTTFYDDRGRPIQVRADNHVGGEDIATTQYDFAGKILHTHTRHHNPQANTTLEVLKRYTYDDAGRLLSIQQKIDNGNFKNISSSEYNELGELSVQKLGTHPTTSSNPLESLNYEYNIRGWMKSINGDYVNNGTGNHYFGMDLSYDYGFDNSQLGGNVAGVKWRTKSGSRQRAYGFKYDNASRLTAANYNHLEGSSWKKSIAGAGTKDFSTTYEYDLNGNITKLKRKGVVAGSTFDIDDLTYGYATNSNQLIKVDEGSATTGAHYPEGFNDRHTSSTVNDFIYDDNGNLSKDRNKDIESISYNYLNLPHVVTFTGNRTITFTYDAAGIKLSKTVNDDGIISKTDYVGGFVYENDDLQFFAHEEGQVRKNYQGSLVNDFFIKDHLGNTRMTLTETPEVIEYRATMETDTTPEGVDLGKFEKGLFLNLDATRETPSNFNTSNEPGINNNETARLNGSDPARRIGPAKMLAVNSGDVIDLSVQYYHAGSGTSTNPVAQTDMIAGLASAFSQLNGGASVVEGALENLFDGPQALAKAYAGSSGDANKPRAYMTYLLFNRDFEYVDGNFYQVDVVGDYKSLAASVNVSEGGYIYVYLSNENPNNFDVHFDDFFITHTKSTILQEDHYYPFGMNISALSSTAPKAKTNNFKYNGFEEQTDFDLGWYDYQARYYDPQLGRFNQVDPAADLMRRHSPYNYAFDNPIRFIDPDGMKPDEPTNSYGIGLEGTAYGHYAFESKDGRENKEKDQDDLTKTVIYYSYYIPDKTSSGAQTGSGTDYVVENTNIQSVFIDPEDGAQVTTTIVIETVLKIDAFGQVMEDGKAIQSISRSSVRRYNDGRDPVIDNSKVTEVELNYNELSKDHLIVSYQVSYIKNMTGRSPSQLRLEDTQKRMGALSMIASSFHKWIEVGITIGKAASRQSTNTYRETGAHWVVRYYPNRNSKYMKNKEK